MLTDAIRAALHAAAVDVVPPRRAQAQQAAGGGDFDVQLQNARHADLLGTLGYVCSRMLTYVHVCSRMLTYADACRFVALLLSGCRF